MNVDQLTHDELKAEYARLREAYSRVQGAGYRALDWITSDEPDMDEAIGMLQYAQRVADAYRDGVEYDDGSLKGVTIYWDGKPLNPDTPVRWDESEGGDE